MCSYSQKECKNLPMQHMHSKKHHGKLDLAHRRTDANCIHRKDNAPKPLGPIISEL